GRGSQSQILRLSGRSVRMTTRCCKRRRAPRRSLGHSPEAIMRRQLILLALTLFIPSVAAAELPPPPKDLAPWSMEWAGGAPGVFSAADLLDKPAGKNGPVVARDGHFYTGDKRVRFWGVNIA